MFGCSTAARPPPPRPGSAPAPPAPARSAAEDHLQRHDAGSAPAAGPRRRRPCRPGRPAAGPRSRDRRRGLRRRVARERDDPPPSRRAPGPGARNWAVAPSSPIRRGARRQRGELFRQVRVAPRRKRPQVGRAAQAAPRRRSGRGRPRRRRRPRGARRGSASAGTRSPARHARLLVGADGLGGHPRRQRGDPREDDVEPRSRRASLVIVSPPSGPARGRRGRWRGPAACGALGRAAQRRGDLGPVLAVGPPVGQLAAPPASAAPAARAAAPGPADDRHGSGAPPAAGPSVVAPGVAPGVAARRRGGAATCDGQLVPGHPHQQADAAARARRGRTGRRRRGRRSWPGPTGTRPSSRTAAAGRGRPAGRGRRPGWPARTGGPARRRRWRRRPGCGPGTRRRGFGAHGAKSGKKVAVGVRSSGRRRLHGHATRYPNPRRLQRVAVDEACRRRTPGPRRRFDGRRDQPCTRPANISSPISPPARSPPRWNTGRGSATPP